MKSEFIKVRVSPKLKIRLAREVGKTGMSRFIRIAIKKQLAGMDVLDDD